MSSASSIKTLSLKERKFLQEFLNQLALDDVDLNEVVTLSTNKRHVVGLYGLLWIVLHFI